MNVFLVQTVLAAKNDDFEGWMQILLVVIMAVVYGLSGIIKAAKSKKLEDEEEQEEQQGPRPPNGAQDRQPRPASPDKGQQYRVEIQPQRPKTAQAKAEKAVPTVPKGPEAKEIKLEPCVEELPEFISETVQGLKYQTTEDSQSRRRTKRKQATPKRKAEIAYFGATLLDVSDPESLRRAILHYEIFGKPMSLRDPGEKITG